MSEIFALQGAQRAIRTQPTACQCCNHLQPVIRLSERAQVPEAVERGTARAQQRPQTWSAEHPR
eukprot:7080408-Alexandrium_andersonii.AAC.1